MKILPLPIRMDDIDNDRTFQKGRGGVITNTNKYLKTTSPPDFKRVRNRSYSEGQVLREDERVERLEILQETMPCLSSSCQVIIMVPLKLDQRSLEEFPEKSCSIFSCIAC